MTSPYESLKLLLLDPPYDTMDEEQAAAVLNVTNVEVLGSHILTSSEFVRRFTPAEFIAARNSADAVVAQLMFAVSVQYEPMSLCSSTVQQGLAYMVSIGLLPQERADKIKEIQPVTVSILKKLEWSGDVIWPSDIIAARNM